MINQPVVKLGIVGVSRDCFPIALTKSRLAALMAEVKKAGLPEVYDCPVTIENEKDTMAALAWAKENGITVFSSPLTVYELCAKIADAAK